MSQRPSRSAAANIAPRSPPRPTLRPDLSLVQQQQCIRVPRWAHLHKHASNDSAMLVCTPEAVAVGMYMVLTQSTMWCKSDCRPFLCILIFFRSLFSNTC